MVMHIGILLSRADLYWNLNAYRDGMGDSLQDDAMCICLIIVWNPFYVAYISLKQQSIWKE